MIIPDIHISGFDYELPQERIAKFPLDKRDMSKLLSYKQGNISHQSFQLLPDLLPEKSALVFNNSKVICARLIFYKESGARIEVFCLEPVDPFDHQLNLQQKGIVIWKCLVGNKRKWKGAKLYREFIIKGQHVTLSAEIEKEGAEPFVKFSWNEEVIFADILDYAGKIPIPPYLMREAEESDKERYQTVYSSVKGSVAAPTAGLHFTPEILEKIQQKGVQQKEFTLHVGAGTFKPVQTDSISGHEMHEETFLINREQLEFLSHNAGSIYAVGTTSTRLLESIYHIGVKHLLTGSNGIFNIKQWEPYQHNKNIDFTESINSLLQYFYKYELEQVVAKTSIIIAPGYRFKAINGLITNFHQPKSTLLLLIAALIGDDWKKVYNYALENEFRFLSYGDSSILIP